MILQNSESTSILVFDLIGNIQDVNLGFQKSFGYSRESIIGKNFSMLFIEEDIRKNLPQKVLNKVMKTGSSHDQNYLKRKNGSKIWVYGECIYVKDENGQGHVVKIIQDLNAEKKLEKKLKEKNEEQKRILKDNATFIYTASHDLTSPVNNIEAMINALDKAQDDPGEIRILVPLMYDSINRVKNKINELSAIGKEQEKMKYIGSKVEFQKILEEVLLDLEEEIKSADAEIFFDFSNAPIINFSKKNLKSILQNLVSNSLKYRSPNRKPQVRVTTEELADDYILLNVKDNGLGIEDKDKERIFQMYQRANTKIKGTGVGLGIVKQIVKNSNGKITLESRVGEGSTFGIYFINLK
jgi:PAS domain S-box-containing protein